MSEAEKSVDAKRYTGGCHCGAVRYEVAVDLGAGAGKCNCSICTKGNYLGAKAVQGTFKLLSGEDSLSDYQFNSNSVHHLFCKRCGIRSYCTGNIPQIGGEFHTVNVHCLDGVDPTTLRVRYSDGRNNNWMAEAPAFP